MAESRVKRHSEQQPDQSLNRRDSPFVSTLGRVGVGVYPSVCFRVSPAKGVQKPGAPQPKLERDAYTRSTPSWSLFHSRFDGYRGG